MQKLDSTSLIITILIALYMTKKVSMYIKYKKSGKIMLKVKLKKDILVKLIWVAIAGVWAVPAVKTYLNGESLSPGKVRSTIFWVCFISIIAFIENQDPKITEGGISDSGSFWDWKDINSCKWSAGEKNILSIEAKSALILLKYPINLRWRVLPDQKSSISSLLKNKMK